MVKSWRSFPTIETVNESNSGCGLDFREATKELSVSSFLCSYKHMEYLYGVPNRVPHT